VSEESVGIRMLMLSVALFPAIVMLVYFWDRGGFSTRAESVWSATGIGAMMAYPVIALGTLIIDPLLSAEGLYAQALSQAFLLAAIPEEGFKLLAVMCIYARHSDVKRPYDIVQLSIAVAVGFSAIENVFYIFGAKEWGVTAALRSMTAVPAHAFFGAVMGTMVARARFGGSFMYWPLAFVVPAMMHGAYNFVLFLEAGSTETLVWVVPAFVIILTGMALMAVYLSGTMRTGPVMPRHRRQKLLWSAPALSLIVLGVVLAVILPGAEEIHFAGDMEARREFAYAGAIICIFFGALFLRHGWRRHP
jgi:protease PrsW